MPDKECRGCKQVKDLGAFYKRKKGKDGIDPQCKECRTTYQRKWLKKPSSKIVVQKWLEANKNYGHEYYESHKGPPAVFMTQEERAESDKKSHTIARQKHRKKYPDRERARRLVLQALKNGDLIRLRCQVRKCKIIGQAHHPDYSKPLEVEWLCRKHHLALHAQLRLEVACG